MKLVGNGVTPPHRNTLYHSPLGFLQGWGILLTTTVSLTVVSHKFTNNLYPVSSPSAVINKQLVSGRRLGRRR